MAHFYEAKLEKITFRVTHSMRKRMQKRIDNLGLNNKWNKRSIGISKYLNKLINDDLNTFEQVSESTPK